MCPCSPVRLFTTPWAIAYQAPLPMGFSRQERWSGLPFPSLMDESEVAQLCPTQQPHGLQPTRLPRPWESPGKNAGVGCHFLLQCMKVQRESEVLLSACSGISISSSIVAVSVYIPTNSPRGFPFLHTLSSIYYLCFFLAIVTSVR